MCLILLLNLFGYDILRIFLGGVVCRMIGKSRSHSECEGMVRWGCQWG